MKVISFLVFVITSALAWQAWAGGELVKFPERFADGVLYATVERGNLKEDIFSSREAIEAAKAGRPLPSGTVITLASPATSRRLRKTLSTPTTA